MYVQRIEVSDSCKSEYDAFGALLPNNGDNGQYTDVETCIDESVCPLARGQFIEGTETEAGDSDLTSAAHYHHGGSRCVAVSISFVAGAALLNML